jgi:hypothetical protein
MKWFAVVFISFVGFGSAATPVSAECSNCDDWFDPWPMKVHKAPVASNGGDQCSPYACHTDTSGGSCFAYHPAGCGGGGGGGGPRPESADFGGRIAMDGHRWASFAKDLLAHGEVRRLERLMVESAWTVAPAASTDGVVVLSCDGQALAYIPLPEEAVAWIVTQALPRSDEVIRPTAA